MIVESTFDIITNNNNDKNSEICTLCKPNKEGPINEIKVKRRRIIEFRK